MGLPRHLQGRFNALDGALLSAQPAAPDTEPSPEVEPAPSEPPMTEPTAEASDAMPEDEVSAPVEPAEPEPGTPRSEATWARMEGRYKAHIRRLEEQLVELKEQARSATTLTDLLARTREELTQARTPPTPIEPTPAAPTLTEEEAVVFGDFAPVAEKLIAKATAPLQRELEQLRTQTGAVDARVGEAAEALFVGQVRSQVSAFDAIRNDPGWVEFLQRAVPYTAHTMGSALAEAHQARDLERVVSIFDAFTRQQASTPVAPTPSVAAPDTGLAQFATPPRSAANPSDAVMPKFREGDYRARLADLRAGRLSKPEFLQFEQDFDAARRSGRLAP